MNSKWKESRERRGLNYRTTAKNLHLPPPSFEISIKGEPNEFEEQNGPSLFRCSSNIKSANELITVYGMQMQSTDKSYSSLVNRQRNASLINLMLTIIIRCSTCYLEDNMKTCYLHIYIEIVAFM